MRNQNCPTVEPYLWLQSSFPVSQIPLSIFPKFFCYSNCSYFRSENPIVRRINFPGFGEAKIMDFPCAASPIRDLMVELLSTVETHLAPFLQRCNLPPDVQRFESPDSTNHASLRFRRGLHTSNCQIYSILAGWMHWKLPSGQAINTSSLATHLNALTEAPDFVIVITEKSPKSFVLILDLVPRVDLAKYPDYIKTFYEDTDLGGYRQIFETLLEDEAEAEVTPFVSPSLYIRSVFSPTAVLATIETSDIKKVIQNHVEPVSKKLLQIWIESCASVSHPPKDMLNLGHRDKIIIDKFLEILGSTFPTLFGEEVGEKVMQVLKSCFNV